MSREEAIEVIKAYRDKLTNSASNQLDGDIEAFDIAIQALSQEPTEKPMTVDEMEREYEKSKALFHKIVERDDAISREAVYSILNEYHIGEEEIDSAMDECQNLTVNAITSDVSLLPSVTQKSGKWIKGKDEYGTNHFTCPFCGHDIATKAENWDDNYCANCGADLRGAE